MTNEQLSDLLDERKSLNVYSFTYNDEEEDYEVLTTDCEKKILDVLDVELIVPFGGFHIFVLRR